MITEDYVSYDVAKLLKEKGFNELCLYNYWGSDKELHRWNWELSFNNNKSRNQNTKDCAAPTHQMAIKWIKETYNIEIFIQPSPFYNGDLHYYYTIYKLSANGTWQIRYASNDFDKKEDAINNGIIFTFENIISIIDGKYNASKSVIELASKLVGQDKEFLTPMIITISLLNSVDIESIIKRTKNIDVSDLMDEVEEALSDEIDKYSELEGSLFLVMGKCEFIDYLKDRYKDKLNNKELTKVYISINE